MEAQTLKYISENQLISCMNDTKWKELIYAINTIVGYEPMVNIRWIFDEKNKGGFSQMHWAEVAEDGFERIEQMQIDPIKKQYVGRLVAPQTTDFTEQLKTSLDKHHIPYDFEGGIFTIYGYRRPRPESC